MLTKNMVVEMLTLQDKLNSQIDENWRETKNPFLRAVLREAVEAMDHYGWKWWKSEETDLMQVKMELVDIWHFIISEILCRHSEDQTDEIADELGKVIIDSTSGNDSLNEIPFINKLELLVGESVMRNINIPLFNALLVDCELEWGDLYKLYIGKNVLNAFRQDHGYKEGVYKKNWYDGREDNEHLVEVLDNLQAADGLYDEVYDGLTAVYENDCWDKVTSN